MTLPDIKPALEILDKYEEFIFNNEEKFLDRFCYGGDGLLSLSFNMSHAKFTFLVDTGATWVNSIKIEELLEWIESIDQTSR